MKKIVVRYVDRATRCPQGYQVFKSKDLDEANVLAANYQSRHPELEETNFEIS